MNFGEAIEALKNGEKVTRKGWNGKNMFLWLKPGTIIQEQWCHDPVLLKLAQNNGGTIEALPTICMKTADNKVLTGWFASQTDILAVDWQFYSEYDEDAEFHPLSVDWDIPEEERVTDEDLNFINNDDRFSDAFNTVNGKIESLRNEEVDAKSVIDGLKEEFKMEDENGKNILHHQYKEAVTERDVISELNCKIQMDVLGILNVPGKNKDEKKKAMQKLEQQYLDKAKTEDEKQAIVESFNIFIDYMNNN